MIAVLQGFVDTEQINPKFGNKLNFMESDVKSIAIKLNKLAFQASNLSFHDTFAVTKRDVLSDIFNIEQAIRRVAIMSTSSTVTNSNTFRETLIFGGSHKYYML
jgi:hypothetical protein